MKAILYISPTTPTHNNKPKTILYRTIFSFSLTIVQQNHKKRNIKIPA
jgi:hypothetical protein